MPFSVFLWRIMKWRFIKSLQNFLWKLDFMKSFLFHFYYGLIFMKIYKSIFMSIYRIYPCECLWESFTSILRTQELTSCSMHRPHEVLWMKGSKYKYFSHILLCLLVDATTCRARWGYVLFWWRRSKNEVKNATENKTMLTHN